MLPQLGVEWPPLDERNLHMCLHSLEASTGTNLDMMFYPSFDLLYDVS